MVTRWSSCRLWPVLLCTFVCALLSVGCSSAEAHRRQLQQMSAIRTSSVWGMNGELWRPTGRVNDYSYAGYGAGEEDIPTLTPTHNVRDFGADGSDQLDDTPAFERAISEIPAGVLLIPPGRYILTRQLRIDKRISLKGAGSSKSVLIIPRSLGDVYAGGGLWGARSSAFIEYVGGRLLTDRLADITATARRGDNVIKVDRTTGMAVGEWVSVVQGPPADGNWGPMNQGVPGGCTDRGYCDTEVGFGHHTRLAQILDGNTIVVERPLPWDLFPNHQPKYIARWAPELNNIGIEGLGMMFMAGPYEGHFRERGWNGIDMGGIANSWIKDVQILNADVGINVARSAFITVAGVRLLATRAASGDGATGHYGITLIVTQDSLVTYFDLVTSFEHDVSVDKFATGNVFSVGRGVNLNLDHHRAQNYGNLWTQLDFGRSTRPFASGGSASRGMHAGSFNTFWNLGRTSTNLPGLPADFGPALNFAGLPAGMDYPGGGAAGTWQVEPIPQDAVYPPNLHIAQWGLRMSSPNKVAPQLGGKGPGGKRLSAY